MSSMEVLLAHARFLRGLSRALVADEHLADDLVQDTWLAALRRPPVETDSARPWVARVFRNLRASAWRRDSRRRRRELGASRREVLASAAEIAEREDAARRVIEAVFRLDEPYRSAVLHRFYEGLAPRDIARLQGLPVETVRTRLKRALEMLRRDLDRDFGGRAAWAVPLLAFPGRDGAALAATGTVSAAPGIAGGALSTGAIIMSAKTIVLTFGVTVVLGVACAIIYKDLRAVERRAEGLAGERDALARRVEELGSEASRRAEELALAGSREKELRRRIEELFARAGSREGAAAEPAAAKETGDRDAGAVPSSLDDAEALASDLMARGDLEGLLDLAAELLRQGEPGYEKVLELFPAFEESIDDKGESPLRLICSQGELVLGTMVRSMTRNHDEMLRFLVWLDGVPESRRTGGILRAAPGMLSRELGLMLLGQDDGKDPQLLSSLTDIYRRRLSRDLEAGKADRELLLAIGHIRTDEAARLLLDALPRLAPKYQRTAVEALAWQRSAAAVPALRELLAATADPQLAEVIPVAIRHLEAAR
jgi:RNA polymerase sigma-70 factor (ECF subfamily)